METGEEGFTLENILGIDGMEDGVVEKVALRTAIHRLPERERKVVFLRYFKGLTQDRTARVMGVSQVQISRIERKAIEKLREHLTDEGG
jgi:RNA polymerase sporulation-specific sigma factor